MGLIVTTYNIERSNTNNKKTKTIKHLNIIEVYVYRDTHSHSRLLINDKTIKFCKNFNYILLQIV